MEGTDRRPEKRSYVPGLTAPGTCPDPQAESAKRVRIGCLDMPGANDDPEGGLESFDSMEEPLLEETSPKKPTKLGPFKRFLVWLGGTQT